MLYVVTANNLLKFATKGANTVLRNSNWVGVPVLLWPEAFYQQAV